MYKGKRCLFVSLRHRFDLCMLEELQLINVLELQLICLRLFLSNLPYPNSRDLLNLYFQVILSRCLFARWQYSATRLLFIALGLEESCTKQIVILLRNDLLIVNSRCSRCCPGVFFFAKYQFKCNLGVQNTA